MNVERTLEQRAIPRVIYHESLFDENYPYTVAFSPEACADFLFSNGMSSENVSRLSMLITGERINVFDAASYNPINRSITLPALSLVSTDKFQLLKNFSHELKHAIDHSNDKYFRLKNAGVKICAGLAGFTFPMAAVIVSDNDFDYKTALLALVSVPASGMMGFLSMKISRCVNPVELSAARFEKRVNIADLYPIISVRPKVAKFSINS